MTSEEHLMIKKNTHITRRSALAAMTAAGLSPLLPGSLAAKTFYRLSTLGPGTTPNLVMTTFSTLVNQALPEHEIQVNATGAATKHALEVASGKTDFFMSSPTLMYLMSDGKAMYQKIKQAPELAQNVRTLFNFPMGMYHIVVYADSGITSLMGVRGKRVFLGPPGGAALRTMTRLFENVTGYKAGEDFEVIKLGWDSAAQAFQDKNIDVYCNPTNPPSPVISQVAVSNKIRLLGIPQEDLVKPEIVKMSKSPGFRFMEMPPDAYGDAQVNTAPETTLGVNVGVSTHKDLPEEVIYDMVKAFWTGLEDLKADAPWMAAISTDNAFDDMNTKLHPGALRYYKEVGLEVPVEVMP